MIFLKGQPMSRMISTVYKSLLRSVNDLIKDVAEKTGDTDVRYWAWESRADEDKMPSGTVIGVDGYNFDENKGLWIIRAGITLSTRNDLNLMTETEILDIIHDHYGYQKKVNLLHPDTGELFSELYVVEFQVMPMGQSELRNYRTVGIELKRTDTSEA